MWERITVWFKVKIVWQLVSASLLRSAVLLLIVAALVVWPVFAAPQDFDALILVNEVNTIEASYVPEPLLALDGAVRVSRKGLSLREDAGLALAEMLGALEKAGQGDAIVRSAYRSYEYQKNYYEAQLRIRMAEGDSEAEARERVEKRVALPGSSEHQTGLAVDIGSTLDGIITRFHLTDSGQWLAANAHAFGFILRYPEDKTRWTGFGYEPWHFRYVGKPHAEIMWRQGWILEEYLAVLEVSHFIEYKGEGDGEQWIRVALRASERSLPEGAASVQSDLNGNWIGVYVLDSDPAEDSVTGFEPGPGLGVRVGLGIDGTWLDEEKLDEPRFLDSEDLLELMDWRRLVRAMRPEGGNEPFWVASADLILWRSGALMAVVMPGPSGNRFDGHLVHLPVSIVRVRGELNHPLQYVETKVGL